MCVYVELACFYSVYFLLAPLIYVISKVINTYIVTILHNFYIEEFQLSIHA